MSGVYLIVSPQTTWDAFLRHSPVMQRHMLLEGSRAAIQTHGKDHIDTTRHYVGTAENGQLGAGCFVGAVLLSCGMPADELAAVESDGACDVSTTDLPIPLWIMAALRAAQQVQDMGYSWGAASAALDGVLDALADNVALGVDALRMF